MSKILWIRHTSLSISETFIANTLQLLKSNHEVLALSGGSPDLCAFPDSGIEFTGHATLQENAIEKIRRHAFNTRSFDNRRAKRLKHDVMKRLGTFKPDLIWLCYGTTAFDARLLLEALDVPYVIEVHGYDISSQFANASYKAGFVSVANKSQLSVCLIQFWIDTLRFWTNLDSLRKMMNSDIQRKTYLFPESAKPLCPKWH